MMLILLGALATVLSFIIIKQKLEAKRWFDTFVDLGTMLVMGAIFIGTLQGMAIAMFSSLFFSIWLWFFPAKNPFKNKNKKDKK